MALKAANSSANMLFAAADEPMELSLNRLAKSEIEHVLRRERADYKSSLKLAEKIDLMKKFNFSSLEPLLVPQPTSALELSFSSAEEREDAIAAARRFVQSHTRLSAKQIQLEACLQELTLNAFISSVSAFEEESGKTFDFRASPPCAMRISFDDNCAFVACWDPVGSLRRPKILSRLVEAYLRPNDIRITRTAAGQSGFGCKIILDNSSDFIALCLKGKETLVACAIPLTRTARELEAIPKNFHLKVIS